MIKTAYVVAIILGLLSVAGFALGWLGPVKGEGWGRGWYNIIMMIGSGAVGLVLAVVVGIIRFVGKGGDAESALFVIALGVNALPIIGVLMMFLGLVRIR